VRKDAETCPPRRTGAKKSNSANGSSFLSLGSCIFFFARKDAKTQRDLTANGSSFLALGSWLSFLSSFRSQSREGAKKSMRKRLLFLDSYLLFPVSRLLFLGSCIFFGAQRRKEIYALTALGSCLLLLAS
jgi:hypothetical protein